MEQKNGKRVARSGNGAIAGATKKSSSKNKNFKNFKNTRLFKILRIVLVLLIILIIWNVVKILIRKTPDKISLIIGDEKVTLKHNIVIDKYNNIYMSIDDIKNIYDENIYVDNNIVITTYNKHIAVLEIGKTTMKVNDVVLEIKGTLQKINGVIYLPFSDMEDVYDFAKSYNKEAKALNVDSKLKEKKEAVVLKTTDLKESTERFAKTVERVKKTQYVTVFETKGDFARVRTKAGNIGYIKTKKISKPEVVWETMDEEYLENIIELSDYSIVDDKYEILTNIADGTLVFPDLFEIDQTEDNKVEVKSLVDLEGNKFQTYKDWAEQSNVLICPTVKLNCSMSKVGASYESRSYVINTLYNILINNRLTMICIDFTNVDDEEGLNRFIIEMVPRFKCAGMKVLIRNNGSVSEVRD